MELGSGGTWCQGEVIAAGAWESLHTCAWGWETSLCLDLPTGVFALADSGGSGSRMERGPPALGQLLIVIKKRK